MDLIIRRTEDYLYTHSAFGSIENYTPTQAGEAPKAGGTKALANLAILRAVARMSRDLRTSAIVTDAVSTDLLSILCAQRPAAMVFALAPEGQARGLACLSWGVETILIPDGESESFLNRATGLMKAQKLEQPGGFLLLISTNADGMPNLSILAN
jgi:pyruvate kinase